MTIYALGLDNDKTLRRFIQCAVDAGETVELVNLHAVAKEDWQVGVPAVWAPAQVYGAAGLHLDPSAGYYARLVDLSAVLPEPASTAWRAMVGGLAAFLETVEGPVVNRPGAQVHNGAKPLHEWWLARQGFDVPAAVTTADPEILQAFLARHGCGIVKSLCGMRGTAQLVTADDLKHFRREQGPIHLQAFVRGHDLRVHLVGQEAFAERILSDAVDYRARGVQTRHEAAGVPEALLERMIRAAEVMGLAFTGWDFKVDADGRHWCLEVNPSPGYDVYDRRADGAISRALIRHLRPCAG